MANAFQERRPWAAAILTVIFDPFIGMLYLNRGWLGLAYLGLEVALMIASWAIFPNGAFGSTLRDFTVLPLLAVKAIGTIHAVAIAHQWQTSSRLRWYARWYALVAIAVMPLAIGLSIRTFLVRSFDVSSTSMSPNLNRGDYLLASLRAFDGRKPMRGDVVVFFVPQHGADYIKRVVGVPGDRVQIKRGTLFINGKPVGLRRVGDFAWHCGEELCNAAEFVEMLPSGRSYDILDSLKNGPLDNTGVFVVPNGSYFVLGDNRDNSIDSRDGLGFVAEKNIIGKVWMKYANTRGWIWTLVH